MLTIISLLFWIMPERKQLYMIANIFTLIEFIAIIIATILFIDIAWITLAPLAFISGLNDLIYKKYSD